jgi:hypothetical protein
VQQHSTAILLDPFRVTTGFEININWVYATNLQVCIAASVPNGYYKDK